MEKIIGTVPGKCRKKREKARLTLNNNPEISWHMKKSRRTYNGVHLNKKSNTQDVVEQSLTIIGSPIWGGLLSSPVKSFLSGYDLSGKKILPFCTHGGSGTAQSVDNIRKLCPHAEILLFMAVKLQTLGMK